MLFPAFCFWKFDSSHLQGASVGRVAVLKLDRPLKEIKQDAEIEFTGRYRKRRNA